jgi:hypothetical protein
MSDRMFAQTCPNCGGICPQRAETCKYCKYRFSGTSYFSRLSIREFVPRKRGLQIALVVLAILMVVVLIVMNILRL